MGSEFTDGADAPPQGLSRARLAISKLTFSDGTTIPVDLNSILVIVGPNNSGKTRALADIYHSLAHPHRQPVCTASVTRMGSVEDLKRRLASFRRSEAPRYIGPEFQYREDHLKNWEQPKLGLNDVARYFSVLLTTTSRLVSSGPVSSHTVGQENPQDAFQMMYEDRSIELQVSNVFREVFGTDLVLNPKPGSKILLYVGERPVPAQDERPDSKSYIMKITQLPTLDQQGDGMKSFGAILLAVKVMPRDIILIDEPEAFLHPPQERRLGRLLAEEQPDSCQIVVATHSEDIIQGLLAKPDRVSIIRLTREGNVNHVKQLENARVAHLWKSPILRYSNVLSGLFHEGVIITEADADCRFYEAVANALPASGRRPLDLLYTYSGGKDRMPILIAALQSLGVPVRVIADVDVLREEELLEKIIGSLGGQWQTCRGSWKATKTAIEEQKNWFRAGDLCQKLHDLLKPLDAEAVVDKKTLDNIARLSRQTSPWDEIKRNGFPGPLKGEAAKTATNLLCQLATAGLFVVPVGEMEGFVKTIGGHGPRWVEQVLDRDLSADPELRDAREFIERVLRSFDPTTGL